MILRASSARHGSETEDPGQGALSPERSSDGIGLSNVLAMVMNRLGLEEIRLDPDRIAPGHAVFVHGDLHVLE